MDEALRTALGRVLGATAQDLRTDYRMTLTEALLYAIGQVDVVLDEMARELAVEGVDGSEDASRIVQARLAGRTYAAQQGELPEGVAQFAEVRDRTVDPFTAKARLTASLDRLVAEMGDKDPWADEES